MIDYKLIAKAINYYQSLNYQYIDLPWHTDLNSMLITTSYDNIIQTNNFLNLVGSAEQSFLELTLENKLPKGKYVGCTPCFRNDTIDSLHQPYFMKVELYQTDNTSDDALNLLISQAQHFLYPSEITPTNEGFDLTINNIEVGSYGRRTHKNNSWLYGTGLAEPRFSFVRKK